MYKISWVVGSDIYRRKFVVVQDARTLYDLWWVLDGYGRKDGSVPRDIKVHDLDGNEIDMSTGIANVAAQGTR